MRREKNVGIVSFIGHLAGELQEQGRAKTAGNYECAGRSFKQFLTDGDRDSARVDDIGFAQLDAQLVGCYEAWLRGRGVRMNTVSFYMRVLRAVCNKAVARGMASGKHPFGKAYKGVEKTRKRAVNEDVIRRLAQMKLDAALSFARDMFLLSVYMRGMAFVDLAHLKKSDISDGYLIYSRHKTGQRLMVKIEPCAQRIIDRYNSDVIAKSEATRQSQRESSLRLPRRFAPRNDITPDYLFPILANASYATALRVQNSRLQRISRLLGEGVKLSTYVARHSWASLAKRSGVPLAVISEGMGHDNETTTRIYLASLDHSKIDDANALILLKL